MSRVALPMLQLRTLGGLALQRDGTLLDQVNAQRKALALLAVLAAAGASGLGREKVMLLLWPESDAGRARGALKQMLHILRRQLGSPDAILGTTELRGHRAAALRHARVHETLLREEWGLEPDPAVAALAARLREPVDPPPQEPATAAMRTGAALIAGEEGEPASAGAEPWHEATGISTRASRPSRLPRPAWWALAATFSAGGVLAAGMVVRGMSATGAAGDAGAPLVLAESAPSSAPAQGSIAVIPFLDLSPEQDQEYFSDGITEELITHLSRAWLVWMAQNPVLREVARDLFTNPAFMDKVQGAVGEHPFGPVFMMDWDRLIQLPGVNPTPDIAGATGFSVEADSSVSSAAIGIDVDRLHRLVRQDSARARDLVRDALIHEFAHVLPVAQSGHIRDATGDPKPGYRNVAQHPVIRGENLLRELLGLPPKRAYGLLADD
jgi:hypothetical protein